MPVQNIVTKNDKESFVSPSCIYNLLFKIQFIQTKLTQENSKYAYGAMPVIRFETICIFFVYFMIVFLAIIVLY